MDPTGTQFVPGTGNSPYQPPWWPPEPAPETPEPPPALPPSAVWGPGNQFNVTALCNSIQSNPNCCSCTVDDCIAKVNALLAAAKTVEPTPPIGACQKFFSCFGGGELCQRWYEGFEKVPDELKKNKCFQTGGAHWKRPRIVNPFRKACYCPGHAAIQVTMCDESTIFYLDSGFWGHIFPPGESRLRDPTWCKDITPILAPW
jgi:hypothetical protein